MRNPWIAAFQYVSRFTLHVSRFTFHVLRFTYRTRLPPHRKATRRDNLLAAKRNECYNSSRSPGLLPSLPWLASGMHVLQQRLGDRLLNSRPAIEESPLLGFPPAPFVSPTQAAAANFSDAG